MSFDVPYPPNYGGVIDVFFKLKALHKLGVKIIFHCFQYGREEQKELKNYCSEIFYYSRNSFFKSLLSTTPFVVKSRASSALLENLNKDLSPILFEGLHTTFPLISDKLKSRKVFVRAHNIEHDFYKGLANSETNMFKKSFFKQESKKLKKYEKILEKVDGVFTIAPYEQAYFREKYGNHCTYIPAFHDHEIHTELESAEDFILYHGDIRVSDNVRTARFLIEVFKNAKYNFKIASGFENSELIKEIEKYPNIDFIPLRKPKDLNSLFERAQIHTLLTFQKTGIKLKLLNTLYQGRHIIANAEMIEDTGLEHLCHLGNSKDQILKISSKLLSLSFDKKDRKERFKALENFHPDQGAQKMMDIIFQ